MAAILREVAESQGALFAPGGEAPQLQAIAQRLRALCRPAAGAAAAAQQPQPPGASPPPALQQLQGQLMALKAALVQRDTEHAAALALSKAALAQSEAALAAALQGRQP